ncbi:MAG: hypothetical protein AAF432_13730 [Planctomycetota bacterium]
MRATYPRRKLVATFMRKHGTFGQRITHIVVVLLMTCGTVVAWVAITLIARSSEWSFFSLIIPIAAAYWYDWSVDSTERQLAREKRCLRCGHDMRQKSPDERVTCPECGLCFRWVRGKRPDGH